MLTLTPEAWAQIRHDYERTARPVDDICLEHGITANTLRHRARRWGWTMRRQPIPPEGPPAVAPPVLCSAAPLTRFTSPHSPSKTGVNALMVGEVGLPTGPREARPDDGLRNPGEAVPTVENPGPPHPNPLATGERECAEFAANPGDDAPAADEAITSRRHDGLPSSHLHAPPGAGAPPIHDRLQGAIGRVMPAIETALATLAAGPAQPRQMELAARALGSLTRTLRELNALLEDHRESKPPRDIDEVRRSLARKLEAAIAAHYEDMPRRYLAAWQDFAAEAEDKRLRAETAGDVETEPMPRVQAKGPRISRF